MKKALIGLVVVGCIGGTYFLVEKLYNEKMIEYIEITKTDLEKKGMELEYSEISSSILGGYTKINNITLKRASNIIHADSVKLSKGLFVSGEKFPNEFLLEVKGLVEKSSDIEINTPSDMVVDYRIVNDQTFVGGISWKNPDLDFQLSVNIGGIKDMWKCYQEKGESCDFTTSEGQNNLNEVIFNELKVSIKDSGYIDKELEDILNTKETSEINRFKEDLVKGITSDKALSEKEKKDLAMFFQDNKELTISIKQKRKGIASIAKKFGMRFFTGNTNNLTDSIKQDFELKIN